MPRHFFGNWSGRWLYSDTTPNRRGRGRLALRILQGADVSEIPITKGGDRKPIFDWRQLQRWQVDASRLPKDSELRFREPRIWERYFYEILGIGAAILIQTIFIGWLFYEHWRRQRAEVLARHSMLELSHMNSFWRPQANCLDQ